MCLPKGLHQPLLDIEDIQVPFASQKPRGLWYLENLLYIVPPTVLCALLAYLLVNTVAAHNFGFWSSMTKKC